MAETQPLHPQQRQLFLSALQPPESDADEHSGYRLDYALGTTYSLDLIALLSVPVACTFRGRQSGDGKPIENPLALLKALRQQARRILLFVQAGRIHLPQFQPLLAELEQAVIEATAPKGGSFHPKLWVIRYVANDDPQDVRYRVLCLSRNLTFDRCWDTFVAVEGSLRHDLKNGYRENQPLIDFLKELPSAGLRKLDEEQRAWHERICQELRFVKFAPPEPFDELVWHPLGLGTTKSWPFPPQVDRSLVISPFVEANCLERLQQSAKTIDLVSRSESLLPLPPATLQSYQRVWTMAENAEPEAAELEAVVIEANHVDSATEQTQTLAQPAILSGLHAKIYLADYGARTSLWTGSANATNAAFSKNVEFLMELRGPKKLCGVETILGVQDGKKKESQALIDLLQSYVAPQEAPVDVDAAAKAFEDTVQDLAQAMAESRLSTFCEPAATADTYRCELRVASPLNSESFAGIRLRVWPISLGWSKAHDVIANEVTLAAFADVSLTGLTAFYVFEATSLADESLSQRFVLTAPLTNPPARRREQLLLSLLGNREQVLKFLLMLLEDDTGAIDPQSLLDATGTGNSAESSLFGSGTLLEMLLSALDRTPHRIDQIADILRDLKKSPEGLAMLPDRFREIWRPIWKVRRKQLRRAKKRAAKTAALSGSTAATDEAAAGGAI